MIHALWRFYSDLCLITIKLGLWFWVPYAVLCGALVWTYPDKESTVHSKLTLLAALPLVWIFVGLWGAYFSFDYEEGPHNPHWVAYPIYLGTAAYLGCAVGLIAYLRGARRFASSFAFLNLYFMLYMYSAASKAVTTGI